NHAMLFERWSGVPSNGVRVHVGLTVSPRAIPWGSVDDNSAPWPIETRGAPSPRREPDAEPDAEPVGKRGPHDDAGSWCREDDQRIVDRDRNVGGLHRHDLDVRTITDRHLGVGS